MIGIPEAFWFLSAPPVIGGITRRRAKEAIVDRRRQSQQENRVVTSGQYFRQESFAAVDTSNYWDADFWDAEWRRGAPVTRRQIASGWVETTRRRPREYQRASEVSADFFDQEYYGANLTETFWGASFWQATTGIPTLSEYFGQGYFSDDLDDTFWSAAFWQAPVETSRPQAERRRLLPAGESIGRRRPRSTPGQ